LTTRCARDCPCSSNNPVPQPDFGRAGTADAGSDGTSERCAADRGDRAAGL
jgi:hypothetical protein